LVRYISHAKERMKERSITETEVEEALARPLETVQTRYGRSAACALRESGRCLVVIFERSQEDFLVITALKVDQDRARRFGFTRV
jgi:Domain of unknown function (DUF4258)